MGITSAKRNRNLVTLGKTILASVIVLLFAGTPVSAAPPPPCKCLNVDGVNVKNDFKMDWILNIGEDRDAQVCRVGLESFPGVTVERARIFAVINGQVTQFFVSHNSFPSIGIGTCLAEVNGIPLVDPQPTLTTEEYLTCKAEWLKLVHIYNIDAEAESEQDPDDEVCSPEEIRQFRQTELD